jgi:uncharacterized metal-binding protein YceD (DUF177 family)
LDTGPELSRRYGIDRVGAAGVRFDISASAEERRALEQRLELASLRRLEARGRIERRGDGQLIGLSCRIVAELEQICVVTLEPVPATLDFLVERLFLPETGDLGHAIALSPEVDEPDPLALPFLDVGEIVTEELALALDPYPRAAGADDLLALLPREPEPEGPFAGLAAAHRQAH